MNRDALTLVFWIIASIAIAVGCQYLYDSEQQQQAQYEQGFERTEK